MIIFTNVRKSVDYKDFVLQNVHPAEDADPGVGGFKRSAGLNIRPVKDKEE